VSDLTEGPGAPPEGPGAPPEAPPPPPIGARHFGVVRAFFGLYLAVHFAYLIPYGTDLFSSAGMVGDAATNLSYGFFPNPLNWLDAPWMVTAFLAGLTGLSLALMVGVRPPWLPVLLWFGWACLLNRNVFIRNPGMPYVGWMLLALPLIPRGEGFALGQRPDAEWRFPTRIWVALWGLLAVGYTLSGIDKAMSPSWQDGSALSHVLTNPLSRDHLGVQYLLQMPTFLMLSTWGALALETLYLPLALWRRSRPWVWLAMVGMQLGILLLVDFADLTLGVLMVHLWTFDARWLKPRTLRTPPIVFFDGVCGLCNASIDLLVQEDFGRVLRFAPLQGEAAQEHLTAEQIADLDSFYYARDGQLFNRSSALLRVCADIGGPWRLLAVGLLLPLPIRDGLYRLVAANRYRLFGKHDVCRLPAPHERALFLS